jgi:hypothetical protein
MCTVSGKNHRRNSSPLISAAPGLLLGTIGAVENIRQLVVMQLAVFFRFLFFFVGWSSYRDTVTKRRVSETLLQSDVFLASASICLLN